MKPSWKHAPEWAQWLAKGATGDWCWYETKPVLGRFGWLTTDRWEYEYDEETERAGYDRSPWKESLEERP